MGNTNETTGAEALFASLSEEQTLELGKLLGELGIAAVEHVLSIRSAETERDKCALDPEAKECGCSEALDTLRTACSKHEKAATALTDAILATVSQ